MKFNALPLTLILLISCHAQDAMTPSVGGEQQVFGYYFEPSAPRACIIRYSFGSKSKSEIYQAIDDHAPEFSVDTEFYVTGIGYGDRSFVDLASPYFCNKRGFSEAVIAPFASESEKSEFRGNFEIYDINDLLSSYGVQSLDLQHKDFPSSDCVVEFDVDDLIDGAAIYELRYRYAIPILYHQWSSTKSIVLFGNQCERSDGFTKDILDLGFATRRQEQQ